MQCTRRVASVVLLVMFPLCDGTDCNRGDANLYQVYSTYGPPGARVLAFCPRTRTTCH